MSDPLAANVRVSIHETALLSIYHECDCYAEAETGGRLVGTYRKGGNGDLLIEVSHVIGPGPEARRTAVSFFQDGDYQERIFREIESNRPEIEHLGNWHSHHVNGMPTLSAGDRATYHRIVNHRLHNTEFFYALLVVNKNTKVSGLDRYRTRHFLLLRDDPVEYEIPASQVQVIRDPAGTDEAAAGVEARPSESGSPPLLRVFDQGVLKDMQPAIKPYYSRKARALRWKGPLQLLDGSSVDVVIAELPDAGGSMRYSVQVLEGMEGVDSSRVITESFDETFASATEAVWTVERRLNLRIVDDQVRRVQRRRRR